VTSLNPLIKLKKHTTRPKACVIDSSKYTIFCYRKFN